VLGSVAWIAVAILLMLSLYQCAKYLLFPDVTLWQSDLMTIVFGTALATALAFQALHREACLRNEADARRTVGERLIAILEATPDLVAISQLEGPVSYINAAGRRLLGIGLEERPFLLDHRSAHDRKIISEEAIPTAVRDGVWTGESVLLSRAGEEIIVSQVLIAHKGPSGAVEFLSTIARDIRGQRRLEEEFRQAQKMDAIGRLAAGVAHDFNNLLTIITGYSQLLLANFPENSSNHDLVKHITIAGDRAIVLTRQLLAFSRKQILAPKVLSVKELLDGMEKMLRRLLGEDIQLVTVTQSDLGPVKADPGQLEQVVMNLAVNARDAMPQGGSLTIELQNVELDETYARTHPEARPGAHVLLAITDTGIGMDTATQARVFEPFFSTKGEKGTGLGLATVYGIVKQSGGHVTVCSEPGIGAAFKVYLPRAVEQPALCGSDAGLVVLPRGGETILLVEDEDSVRALARHILQESGYTVLEAAGAETALRMAQQPAAKIDLLVTDVVMPHIDGRDLADRLSTLRPETKVLFLSGYTNETLLRHRLLTTQVHFLEKPFSPGALISKVREVLDNGRPTKNQQSQICEANAPTALLQRET
jgi:signal transduction histidine kinase/CheY-like chemotaxis protein